jgi:hypothetical protein
MSNLTNREKQFYRILAALQELYGVQDQDLAADPELNEFLKLAAKVGLQLRTLGPKKFLELRPLQPPLRVLKKPKLRVVPDPTEPDPA